MRQLATTGIPFHTDSCARGYARRSFRLAGRRQGFIVLPTRTRTDGPRAARRALDDPSVRQEGLIGGTGGEYRLTVKHQQREETTEYDQPTHQNIPNENSVSKKNERRKAATKEG